MVDHGSSGQRLSDVAYERLEELIVTLRVKPGEVVTETELMRLTSIGRTPLREAIQRFSAQGLMSALPRRGIRVNDINQAQCMALLSTRRVLDRLIASSAAHRATRQHRAALQSCAAAIRKAAERDNLEAFLRADHECDLILDDAASNPFASQALAPLHVHCRRFWYTYRHDGDLGRAARLHSTLMTRVARGDEQGAERASDSLIDYLQEFMHTTIDG
jgi:DNA-binding GntR family transcriptional regulator